MKLFKQTGLILSAALLTFACGGPSETVETSEAKEVAEATGQAINLDMDATTISWRGYKPAGQHFGKIPATEGSLMVTGDKITGGKFTFDITGLKIEDLEEGSENYGKLWGSLCSLLISSTLPTIQLQLLKLQKSSLSLLVM